MNNFDLRKYLQNNILLQEEINLRDLKEIKEFLIDAGYKRSEVNEWAREFSRDLQRGIVKDEDQLKSLFERWLDADTTYTSLEDGLRALRDSNQSIPSSVKAADTEVETEPFDGNIVKIKQPEPTTIEVDGDQLKVPFLKKVGGKLADIWNDDIKGFFSEDLRKIYDDKVKVFLKDLLSKKNKAEKEAQELRQQGEIEQARDALKRTTEFEPDEYNPSADVPEDFKEEHFKLLLDGLTGELEELVGGRKYDSDVVDSFKNSFNNIDNPLIKDVLKSEAEVGNAKLFNIVFIDGKVAKFLETYRDLIEKGVYMYQDRSGEWQHNLPKIKVDFYKYLSQQQEKNGWNFSNWDTTPATHSSFGDPAPEGGEFGTPYDDINPNIDADTSSLFDKVLDAAADLF